MREFYSFQMLGIHWMCRLRWKCAAHVFFLCLYSDYWNAHKPNGTVQYTIGVHTERERESVLVVRDSNAAFQQVDEGG